MMLHKIFQIGPDGCATADAVLLQRDVASLQNF
jgi:hypothetical protein